MMRARLTLVLLIALPLIGACETKPSNITEHYGDAVRNGRAQMIASVQQKGVQPMGLGGATATGIARNYHWNQDVLNSINRQNAESGLMSMGDH